VRFDRLAAAALAAVSLAGCDIVFGVTGEATPCDLGAFDSATPEDVSPAEDFSFDWEETFGVVQLDGATYEIDPTDAALTPIDLGPYINGGLALTPEGDALFYTILIEPLTLRAALRGEPTAWVTDAGVPRGTFAGTPSADVFGPRRVMVKMRPPPDTEVVEYEDVGGRWSVIGAAPAIEALRAPNLTPDGLTMVWTSRPVDGEHAVFAAQRSSTKAPFGEPVKLLAGDFANAQLLGRCKRLYTDDSLMLRRYDR
jgi:hypothetical protein